MEGDPWKAALDGLSAHLCQVLDENYPELHAMMHEDPGVMINVLGGEEEELRLAHFRDGCDAFYSMKIGSVLANMKILPPDNRATDLAAKVHTILSEVMKDSIIMGIWLGERGLARIEKAPEGEGESDAEGD